MKFRLLLSIAIASAQIPFSAQALFGGGARGEDGAFNVRGRDQQKKNYELLKDTTDPKRCETVGDPEWNAACFSFVAQNTKDFDSCGKLATLQARDDCFLRMAAIKADAKHCSTSKTALATAGCKAIKDKDSRPCLRLNEIEEQICLQSLALSLRDPKVCEMPPADAKECKRLLGIELQKPELCESSGCLRKAPGKFDTIKDPSECEKLQGESKECLEKLESSLREECQIEHPALRAKCGYKINDRFAKYHCLKMDDPTEKNGCYLEAGASAGDKSACDAITDRQTQLYCLAVAAKSLAECRKLESAQWQNECKTNVQVLTGNCSKDPSCKRLGTLDFSTSKAKPKEAGQ